MTRHFSYKKGLAGFLIVLYGLSSCHKEAVVPTSLLPFTCQIGQAIVIYGPASTTFTYQYDPFGNQTVRKDSGTDGSRNVRTYTYDADEYLTSQKVNGTAYTYTYAGTPKLISHVAGGTSTYDYTYDGATLKTFVVKNGSATSTYDFTAGQLSKITPGTGDVVVVAGGKITQRTTAAGFVTNYTYDNQGQATQIESINPATGERTVSQYTYDNKPSFYESTLRARGFPVVPLNIQPGYDDGELGGPVLLNNYQTIATTYAKKDASGTYITAASATLTYRHLYNSTGYSLGYARSDGARAKFYYTNCK